MIGETVDGEGLAHVGHEEGAVAQHPAQLHRPQVRRHHHHSARSLNQRSLYGRTISDDRHLPANSWWHRGKCDVISC
jgi:hypothetical protein